MDIKCDQLCYNRLFTEIDASKVVDRHPELEIDRFVSSHELINYQMIEKCAKKVLSISFNHIIFIGYQSIRELW